MTTQVRISQPDGLSLVLSAAVSGGLDVTVEGGGLSARASVSLCAGELVQFFRDAATGTAPSWGRWEYKPDEDFMLHAAPRDPDEIWLWLDLLSTDDMTDWQVNGTIVLPVSRFLEYAAEVARAFSRPHP